MPQLSQKQDAVPGQFNSLVVTPTRTGTFPVICTELCGLGHALMRSHVDILTEAKFDAWLKGGGQAPRGPPGLAVFQQNGCGGCHTLKAAGGDRQGRPRPRQPQAGGGEGEPRRPERVHQASRSSTRPRTSRPAIPDAMPHIFGTQIPGDKLNQLVAYLAGQAG